MSGECKVLIIQARNLGDAVISTSLVETIAYGFPTANIDVLTRPETAQIFANNPHVNQVFTGRFPVGSLEKLGWKDVLALPGHLNVLHRRAYTDVINLWGDFREELLGRLITRQNNWSPAWALGHPCSKVIRRSRVTLANRPVPIPDSKPNIYDAAAILGTAVTGATAQRAALYTSAKEKITWNSTGRTIGLHPMASQPWRCWNMEKWVVVARTLVERGMDVAVLGAPSEATDLEKHFAHLHATRICVQTGSLMDYFTTVSGLRMLLCPDSFASHVAYALGVPAILLNGANDATAWAPPGTAVLAAGPGLKCYPCYNRPTCFGTAGEYACVRRIETDLVLKTVSKLLANMSADDASPFPLIFPT